MEHMYKDVQTGKTIKNTEMQLTIFHMVVENATGIPARLKFAIKRSPVQVIIFYV